MLPSATAFIPDEYQRNGLRNPLGHPGFELDAEANQASGIRSNTARSKPLLRIAADQEAVLRELVEVALAWTKDD